MAEMSVTRALTRMVCPSTFAPVNGFVNSSLYVGDLDGNVTEGQLFDLFSTVGRVASVRVCCDREKGVSLGYGYVNYNNAQDAKKAQELLNFTRINGKQIRIMFSNRDPSTRKSGIGNVFVKNLDSSIDNKFLYDTFAVFGTVLTCKVAVNSNGESKGYGFVQFDREEVAQTAIRTLNRKLMNDKRVYVGPFIRQEERRNIANVYEIIREANLYMKNLDESITDDMLEELFSEFGTIKSCKVMLDPKGVSKGFGFVAFSKPDEAKRAMDEMKGKMVGRKPLYVTIAQPKAERMALLRAHFGPSWVHPGAPNLAPQPLYLGQGGPRLLPRPGYGIMTGVHSSNFLMIPYVPLRRGRSENHSAPISPPSPHAMSRQPMPDGPSQLFRHVFSGRFVADNRMVEALMDNDVFQVPFDIASSSSQVNLQLSGPIDHRGKFASVLAFATPQNQRWILSEHLFPLVEQIERENAAKVTEMLLDSMDLTEVIHLIESPEALKTKVAEAMETIISRVEF
ncbi:polyadenylate-binding protein 2 [Cynara cardunculus var. scolymus]|uniref:polyadenylate-binding protein 2 n=1 Tax=Cynara cardunculus var. scolymus TaxID=59895 RepID=UPI000D627809|nr:polyadenylate-binding protein 2 [Cynara cardunculus var. scolymus]